jgi:hypothetical protein
MNTVALGQFVSSNSLGFPCQYNSAETIHSHVRFQVLTAASMMFRIVFWDILPCKMIVDRRFRGAYCLHHQGIPDDISQKTILNIHSHIALRMNNSPVSGHTFET